MSVHTPGPKVSVNAWTKILIFIRQILVSFDIQRLYIKGKIDSWNEIILVIFKHLQRLDYYTVHNVPFYHTCLFLSCSFKIFLTKWQKVGCQNFIIQGQGFCFRFWVWGERGLKGGGLFYGWFFCFLWPAFGCDSLNQP